MNNTRIKSINKTLCYILAFLLASIGCISLLNIFRPSMYTYAATSTEGMKELSITNGKFDKNPKSTYPFSPDSFDDYIYNTEVNNVTPNVNSGVVNLKGLNDEDFADKLSDVPVNQDSYVLMIDSENYDTHRYYTTNFGYRTSSSNKISLDAGKYYMISVYAYTLQNDGIASIYLYNGNEVLAQHKKVSSPNRWTPYYFMVKTNNNESLELSLGMYLDGAGTVLYDNVSCHELNASLFRNKSKQSNATIVDQVDNIVSRYTITAGNKLTNAYDENDDSGITQIDFVNGKNSIEYTTGLTTNNNISDGDNKTALAITNIKETFVKYSTEDDFIRLESANVYKVAVRARVDGYNGTFNGKATLQLIQTNNDDPKDSEVISITSKTSSEINNKFVDYTFFINSHPTQDSTYKLLFGLGDIETLTQGTFYLSSVTVSKTNYDAFSNADKNKIDLAKDLIYSDSEIMLDNGTFDGFKINDYNEPFPATPIDWSVGLGEHTQYYGVVNNNDRNLFSNLGINAPYNHSDNENLLLMYNTTNDTLTYTSESKSITADSYHKYKVSVMSVNAPIKLSLVATKDSNTIELSSILVNSATWQDITLLIHGGHEDMNVSLKVKFTTTNGAGYAYVDNAKFDYPDTAKSIKDQYTQATNNETTILADLSNLLYTNHTTPWSETSYFTGSGSQGVQFGIIPINNNDESLTNNVVSNEDLTNFKKATNNVLAVRLDNGYYTISSNLGYKMESADDKFYQISVSVFTKELACSTLTEEEILKAVGIKLSNFDETFTEITSDGDWTKYTFYIDPSETTTTNLTFNIGAEDQLVSGTVFFSDIQFKTLTSEEFNTNAIESDYVKVLKNVVEPTEDEDTESEDTAGNNSNWIYYIPSILFAVAIVIAIVGVLARKIKWKKPTKKSKTAYDRNTTVSKQVLMRRATTLRENKLMELNKDLSTLTEERSKYETEYKQNLTKIRELKIKRANPSEISKLEKEMKKYQKLSANIGNTINNLEAELEYTKSEAYINSLMKKLAREGNSSEEK